MAIANYKQLITEYDSHRKEIKSYFAHLPELIEYVFSRVERAHRRTLYCGIVKKFSTDSDLTDEITRNLYLKRDEFLDLFKAIFGVDLDPSISKHLQDAERIRDKGVHGKEPTDAEMREAMKEVLQYSTDYDDFVLRLAGFRPFGDLRGFKGRAENIDKETTKLILKGLGFKLQ
jgi:hypothetical protein